MLAKSNTGLTRRAKGQIAPVKATELVSLTSHTNFAEGMAAERDCFLALRQSEQAKALRHLFFAERGAKAPAALANHMPKIIDQAVVVGGGTMGAGIAHALVRAGITTVTIETNEAAAKQAAARAESLIEAGVKRGLITGAKGG